MSLTPDQVRHKIEQVLRKHGVDRLRISLLQGHNGWALDVIVNTMNPPKGGHMAQGSDFTKNKFDLPDPLRKGISALFKEFGRSATARDWRGAAPLLVVRFSATTNKGSNVQFQVRVDDKIGNTESNDWFNQMRAITSKLQDNSREISVINSIFSKNKVKTIAFSEHELEGTLNIMVGGAAENESAATKFVNSKYFEDNKDGLPLEVRKSCLEMFHVFSSDGKKLDKMNAMLIFFHARTIDRRDVHYKIIGSSNMYEASPSTPPKSRWDRASSTLGSVERVVDIYLGN